VYGVRTIGQQREFDRIAKETAAWRLDAGMPRDTAAAQARYYRQPQAAYAPQQANTIVAADPTTRRDLQHLSARVDRLERMVTTGAPAPHATVAPAPAAPLAAAALEIYQVSPDGRSAWVSKGSSKGMKQGQTFQVKRGNEVVGQVQVVRVWPEVSELSVLWSNGAVKRGDSAYEVAGGSLR
jgi:hypothetical protein